MDALKKNVEKCDTFNDCGYNPGKEMSLSKYKYNLEV